MIPRERTCILAWLIEGFLAWKRNGTSPPASDLAATPESPRESAVSYKAAKLRHDLAQACMDADNYAISLRDTIDAGLPSVTITSGPAMGSTESMMRECLRLVGSLEVAQHALQRLEEMGAQP